MSLPRVRVGGYTGRVVFVAPYGFQPGTSEICIDGDVGGCGFSYDSSDDESENSEDMRSNLGSSGLIWVHLGSSGLILAHLGPYGFIWAHLGSFGIIWAHMGSSGVIWAHMGSSGPIWAHLGSLGSSGPIWAHRIIITSVVILAQTF